MTNAVSDFTSPITQGFSTDTTPYSGISDAVFSEQGSSLGDTFVDTNTYDFMAPNPSMANYSDNELMGGPQSIMCLI